MKSDGVLENVRFERRMVEHIRKSGLHAVDMHFHTNQSDALRREGFRPIEWWGGLKIGAKYDRQRSPRLVAVAQRA